MNDQNQPPPRAITRFEIVSVALTVIGFLGLGALSLLRSILGVSEREFMAGPTASGAVWLFSGFFIVGLLVLFPLAVFARRRALPPPPVRPMPWYGIFLIPLHLGDPDWVMPRWITWPIMAVFSFLLVVIVIGMIYAFIKAA
jgi:hypothetical protein